MELFDKFIEWAEANHFPRWVIDYVIKWGFPLSLVAGLVRIAYAFFERIMRGRNQRMLNTFLSRYFEPYDIFSATRYFIQTKINDISAFSEKGLLPILLKPKKLIPLIITKVFTLDSTSGKFYLVLADSGMGKTTFLINLYLKYKNKIKFPWSYPKFKIELIALGDFNWPDNIKEIKKKESTILLLDAFDEDIPAALDYKSRIKLLIELTKNFRIIILTCRTQFFPSEKDEPYYTGAYSYGELGEHKFKKVYIPPFFDADIKKYLFKRYNYFNPFKVRKYFIAKHIVRRCRSLIDRPMLLAHIDDLLESKAEFTFSFQLYSALISQWIKRESLKVGIKEKYGSNAKYQELLHNFSVELAMDLVEKNKIRNGLHIYKDELFEINGFSLKDFELEYQNISDIDKKSKSLLIRSADGYYKFSHRTILEYFFAFKKAEQFYQTHIFLIEAFSGFSEALFFFRQMIFVKYAHNYKAMYSIYSMKPRTFNLKYFNYTTDIHDVKAIIITNFQQIDFVGLRLFYNMKYLYCTDPNCLLLYDIYSTYVEIVESAKDKLCSSKFDTIIDDGLIREYSVLAEYLIYLRNQARSDFRVKEDANRGIYSTTYNILDNDFWAKRKSILQIVSTTLKQQGETPSWFSEIRKSYGELNSFLIKIEKLKEWGNFEIIY